MNQRKATVLPLHVFLTFWSMAQGVLRSVWPQIFLHNLGEVIDGVCILIDNPELTLEELMEYIPAPDFPTGGIIMGKRGIYNAFKTGRGSLVIRSRTHIETRQKDREPLSSQKCLIKLIRLKWLNALQSLSTIRNLKALAIRGLIKPLRRSGCD